MTRSAEVIVVGLGAVGAAALYQLARRGIRALGIDQFHPPHSLGSSHGDTRVTRLAIGEGAHYTPFAKRSHEIWRELETATGRDLLRQVGGLIYGSTSSRGVTHGADDFVGTTVAAAKEHGVAHEELDAAAIAERFPQFRLRGDERGYFEPEAGFVRPEACVAAQLEEAHRLGAETRFDEPARAWSADPSGVSVTTGRGTYGASAMILGAGAWLPGLAPVFHGQAKVFRQVLFWFEPDGPHSLFAPEAMPIYIRVPHAGEGMFYGFPAVDGPGGGMKLAGEQFVVACSPDEIDRRVREEECAAMHREVSPHLRITSRCLRAVVCPYTVIPDFDFVIDRHPESQRVWLASACSGHGFKHSSAVGETLAELAITGGSRLDVSRFGLRRLAR